MKKALSLILVLIMAAAMLAGCAGGKDSGGADAGPSVDSFKTYGDIIAADTEDNQVAVTEDMVVYAFKIGDTYYRAKSALSAETSKAYFDVDFADEDYEEQQNAILSPIKIDEMEILNDQILTKEECDALVGKTGKELQDAGWTFSGHNLEDMQFWMNYGPFMYTVTMDGEVSEADYDTFEDETDTMDMTVKSVEFNMFGDATTIE